jgi:hypothetical protein
MSWGLAWVFGLLSLALALRSLRLCDLGVNYVSTGKASDTRQLSAEIAETLWTQSQDPKVQGAFSQCQRR